jgi:hypothetical protein
MLGGFHFCENHRGFDFHIPFEELNQLSKISAKTSKGIRPLKFFKFNKFFKCQFLQI